MCKRRDSQQYLKDIDTATVTTRIVQHYRTDHGKRKLIPIPGSPPDLIAPPPGCPFVARCPYAMNICNSALPEMTRLSQTHCARCRLLDEGAPRIVWEGNRE